MKSVYSEILKSTFDSIYSAPNEAWEQFTESCDLVVFNKNEVIKTEDTTEKYFYFLLTGSVGMFLWKQNNFVCLDFVFEREFSADTMSLFTGKPTPIMVKALEHTEALRMTASNFNKITQKNIGIVIRRIAAEISFIDKQQQQIELLTKSAKERYHILLSKYPNIHNRIAQNHIASYLGITPQSLSRIRSQRS